MPSGEKLRLQVDGKFFRAGKKRVFLKMVTYGPFPDPTPEVLTNHHQQMALIADAGFNALRVYEAPEKDLLNAAQEAGLWVFVGLSWDYHRDFISNGTVYAAAEVLMAESLESWGNHPAVAGVFVANEIPSDMVRWMGVTQVKQALEGLISLGRSICPQLLFAYANYPTTEYEEPDNADFTAMNVYLESREDFASYLPRLHNVAGDRPVLLSEFGFDTYRASLEIQSETLLWYVDESLRVGVAGLTVYAWSDHWSRGGSAIDDWSFGLYDRHGVAKPVLTPLRQKLLGIDSPDDGIELAEAPAFSVIVCTHNGAERIVSCLEALSDLDYPSYEVLVVDDGSTDNTLELIQRFEGVRVIHSEHVGLSAARNLGAKQAHGEIIAYTDDDCEPDSHWLRWLAHAFESKGWDACGGPNLPPSPKVSRDGGASVIDEIVVASAPGAPSHVLFSDDEAEHLPGCNLAVRKKVFDAVGGFRDRYWIAGDDVDFCWRLEEAGYRMGFSAAAFVWHRRRATLWRYFKQQYHYGKAEALLMHDHPNRFKRGGGALWKGCVYSGQAMTVNEQSFIYHGTMGTAPYQQVATTMQPQRPIPEGFACREASAKLVFAERLQPRIRAWARWRYSLGWAAKVKSAMGASDIYLINSMRQCDDYESKWWGLGGVSREQILTPMIEDGWEPLENDSEWDFQRDCMRMIVALEVFDDGVCVLIRVEMDASRRGCLPNDLINRLESMSLARIL